MPYENMTLPLIAFAANLAHHDFSQISADQASLIRIWYWLAIFSRRYSSAAQTYALEDAQALQKAAAGDFAGIVSIINRIQPIVRDKDDLLVIHKKYDAVYKGVLNLVNWWFPFSKMETRFRLQAVLKIITFFPMIISRRTGPRFTSRLTRKSRLIASSTEHLFQS
jgi:hypothetical protein